MQYIKLTIPDWQIEEPIGPVYCADTQCKDDLHNFKRYRPKKNNSYRNKICYKCGADKIDWDRLDKLDITDAQYTINSLNFEFIRSYFFHTAFDQSALSRYEKRGRSGVRQWAINRINKYIRPPSKEIFRDGTQTPKSGDIVFYAQHSIACCCRKCIEEWYGIERNRPLKSEEVEYFGDLIMLYVDSRITTQSRN